MPKQYVHANVEIEVKQRLDETRNELHLPSLSATITFLIDHYQATKPQQKK